ncbi:hypothetical protein AGDE_12525 [Angomonas deanei]|uniref:Uncharacterized protein n=1 Tax=Angomonas deanei TaxID=59799 RepID=A0A7G2CCI2_9TRYP|nr:hypothetical protein AGDE_12525 [Angomonas deanei]CAD2217145.1 hypothetical protein, conserved [Angomonas deanei]|eukprot:EPY24074.1 hypothetical protein AGDE_12525 [Angomonas deanei]
MEDIQFESSVLHHVYMTTLTINLPLRRYSLAAEDIPVEVAKVAGEKKQAAEELCAVLAIQRHFPSVFEEQIAYHPEISEILKGARTSKVDNGVCPPLTAGPRPRLEWAAKREGMQFRLTSDLLQPGRRYETFGVLTSINSWAARLYVSAPGKGEDLFCTTFDSKKAKAENKAMLCLLSKLNRNGEFDDSLEQGKTNKLLDENGLPTPCHEIVPITADTFRTDDLCDPVISSLSSEPADQRPNVEMGDVQPLLSQLRAFTKQENIVAKETIDHDELRDVFKVTLLSADDTVLTTYTHYNKIAATLSAYLQLKLDNETLNSEKTSI